MAEPSEQRELFEPQSTSAARKALRLEIIAHEAHSWVKLTWREKSTGLFMASILVQIDPARRVDKALAWSLTENGDTSTLYTTSFPSAIRTKLRRLCTRYPAEPEDSSVWTAAGSDPAQAGLLKPVALPNPADVWVWVEGEICEVDRATRHRPNAATEKKESTKKKESVPQPIPPATLHATFNHIREFIKLHWSSASGRSAELNIRCTGPNELTWDLNEGGRHTVIRTNAQVWSIQDQIDEFRERFPVAARDLTASRILPDEFNPNRQIKKPVPLLRGMLAWGCIEEEIRVMGVELGGVDSSDRPAAAVLSENARIMRQLAADEEKRRKQREELEARARAHRQLQEERQRQREKERQLRDSAQTNLKASASTPEAKPALPVPEVPMKLELNLELQDTLTPLTDLRGYFLRERAALWWVSNQSDDLLALPHCRIQRLEYQIRTALRVIGPLRGRALLSDEVGLGKTIEAGLVLKEYLTRGMVKRFLVLTVPSLVDQWEEELSDKFQLQTATTNRSEARSDPEKFWRENAGVVASLHTLKQPAHLAVAQTVTWDMLIVDEAHYLRNRTSQAWQAVSVLPRQYLLLLTATPVQNSLEELYNLVTLLQPGQLQSPKEFRARFIDPKKPHQPREPEELRRLLGQVMVRNTRANAGLNLPPRRAETVLFEPSDEERSFWQRWEAELRERLTSLSASQASLWGRLLLQSGGSSPAAWREALKSFPDRTAAAAWSEQAPLEESWKKKCQLLEPLTKGEGGVVIFSQFLHTQAAIAESLRAASVPTFVVNGQVPARERQPITELFRQQGGALLLTHSGTEGRNLQFSHRLVNFDLPWNPMEIEQRIGRLHRLGQQHPVRIYNLVQDGTLQEHLLEILQEKLNLFELVVGETGLILGDRFTSEEFAEEVLRRWRESEGHVAEAMQALGNELAQAREQYEEVRKLDETLFSKDYASL